MFYDNDAKATPWQLSINCQPVDKEDSHVTIYAFLKTGSNK